MKEKRKFSLTEKIFFLKKIKIELCCLDYFYYKQKMSKNTTQKYSIFLNKYSSGETVTLLCTLLNRQPTEYEASVTLAGEGKEGEYAFVHVEQFGYVVSYNPRTTEGKVRCEKKF